MKNNLTLSSSFWSLHLLQWLTQLTFLSTKTNYKSPMALHTKDKNLYRAMSTLCQIGQYEYLFSTKLLDDSCWLVVINFIAVLSAREKASHHHHIVREYRKSCIFSIVFKLKMTHYFLFSLVGIGIIYIPMPKGKEQGIKTTKILATHLPPSFIKVTPIP